MNPENEAENVEAVPAAAPEETPKEPSQEADPIQEELEKVEKGKRTQREKLEYTKQRVEQQLAELENEDENRPLTVKEFRALQAETANKTARQLVDSIDESDAYKALVKHHLESTIRPSGDAQTDLLNARRLVDGVKNRQLAEEATRAAGARTSPSSPSAPPKDKGKEPELTAEQQRFAKVTGLTPDQVKEALTSK